MSPDAKWKVSGAGAVEIKYSALSLGPSHPRLERGVGRGSCRSPARMDLLNLAPTAQVSRATDKGPQLWIPVPPRLQGSSSRRPIPTLSVPKYTE